MYRKCYYSRRTIEKRARRLRRLEKNVSYSDISSNSEDENDHHVQDTQYSKSTTSNSPLTLDDDEACDYEAYHDDEHDNTKKANDIQDDFLDRSPPLYNNSKLSSMKSMKLLMDFLISDVHLDKRNILRLLKLIKFLLPEPNTLPTTWKSIMKLFGRTNLSSTTFLCSRCHQLCGKTTFNTKICRNETCLHSKRSLRTNEIVEIVNLDVRSQLKLIVNRNIKILTKNENYFPTCDISNGSFYQTTLSKSKLNTITLVLHTDGAPLVRTTKQSIWPLFASVVEIPPPLREYQNNIILLALWSSKSKPNVNVFLKKTVDEIKFLMAEGTSFFINGMEFNFVIRTQFFISDLPARSLFLQTTYFNGYYACHYCVTKGLWSGSIVVYPYHHNDLKLRSHAEVIAAAKEAEKNSTGKRITSVQGVKGLSCLLDIMAYPQQILLDYMHLVCLGHVQTLIKRWCQLIDKEEVMKMDNMLLKTRVPHNIHVVYNESISAVECWKAKHSRLFVLNIGLPIGITCLPVLNASHWAIYCVAIKLLHAPESIEDINFAERLINYYCRTISEVYDQSLEYYSLHAHLHLPAQVRLHGGLSFCSAFTFESCIRYIKKQVHGTKHLASQIAYWYDMENIVKNKIFEVPSSTGVNQIDLNNEQLGDYRELVINLIQMNDQQLKQVEFYKRYKHQFTTYHTTLYDKRFKCCSFVISYIKDKNYRSVINYANIVVFYKYDNFVELPTEILQRLDGLYPLVELSNDYDIISVEAFRHKCVAIEFQDVFCISEIRVDFEHD
ncbi:unnamed protein product [Rotaria magnacalcarata]|uniref:Transposase n=2 Tax=Rotaria magnacalcarata TaxID=392030 RepID=A0A816CGY2_9BILA|nr:unnamed protein product [Rotaria magnacalcarata]